MSSDVIPPVITSIARTARERFADGRRMTVRRSHKVHQVALQKWIGGELIPQPLCHVGISGWDSFSMHPSREPVSCGRCLSVLADRTESGPYGTPQQPALFGPVWLTPVQASLFDAA